MQGRILIELFGNIERLFWTTGLLAGRVAVDCVVGVVVVVARSESNVLAPDCSLSSVSLIALFVLTVVEFTYLLVGPSPTLIVEPFSIFASARATVE